MLAERFEACRGHLRAVAHRMLGSRAEADEAVQDAWLRLARSDQAAVEDMRNWLTAVVARICLDRLRTRRVRREEPIGPEAESIHDNQNAERDAVIADSVGIAMMVLLDTLGPAERVAFVLHDIFGVPFDEIAPIVQRSPAATRQLSSRARRRLQGAQMDVDVDREVRRQLVAAFLAASRDGDFAGLLAVLDPDVVLRADAAAVAASLASPAAPPLAPEVVGAQAVAALFKGRAGVAQPVMVDGEPGLVLAAGGRTRVVFEFAIVDGRIVEISLIADDRTLAALELAT